MSTERDELIGILHQTATADRVRNTHLSHVPVVEAKVHETADAIMAAGYRKPRQVTTAFALEGMPKGTLILAANGEVWRKYTHKWDNLDETGDLIYPPHHISLPATVLHVGGAE